MVLSQEGFMNFQLISRIDILSILCVHIIALAWRLRDLTDDKSISAPVMVWCHQATSLYLSQCWPRFMSKYGVSGRRWVIFFLNGTSLTLFCMKYTFMAWKLSKRCQASFQMNLYSLILGEHFVLCQKVHVVAIVNTGIHYSDALMSTMASQITSLGIVYPAVHSGADQRKYQSSASLASVRGMLWWIPCTKGQ